MTILNGLKVLDFCSLLPGPMATMMFADLGADVIHVESERRVDMMRIMPPYDAEQESYLHQHLNRNKRSLALNLKEPESVEIIKKLILEYDIIIEGFRPGVMKRLGIDYETLKSINPRLIYCAITGYGQNGPYAQRPGHDINYLAVAGLMEHSRLKDKKPAALGMPVADIAGGTLHAAVGVLAAVLNREKTGEGTFIDVSMTDGAFAMNVLYGTQFLGSGRNPQPEEEILNGGTFYDYYETKDGRFFSVGSLEPQFRKQLCEALEIPELLDNSFNGSSYTQRRFKDAVCDAFLSKTFDQWLEIFNDDFNGCVEPVLTFEEATNHPQLKVREMIVDVPYGNGAMQKQIGSALKFSNAQPTYNYVGVKLGTHTNEILSSLGYEQHDIEALQNKGVLK